jgi:hypothetical protein
MTRARPALLPWEELWEPPRWRDLPCPADRRRAIEAALERHGIEPFEVRPRRQGGFELLEARYRWRAVRALILSGRWAPDLYLPCWIVDGGRRGCIA